jgi:aspartyl-tRNA(Asn)/glutamyl-tRNA(Gln) amidotransferase subunit C
MIGSDEVKKIAELARLELTAAESAALENKLNSTLEYFEQLQQIDVSELEPMSHAHGATNVFRADEVVVSESPAELLKNTPDRSGSFIRVPLIIEQNFES